MAHPFFDVPIWPAWRADAMEFEKLLADTYKIQAVIGHLYEEAAPGLEPLNLAQAPRLVWGEALRNLVTAGQLKAFCELMRIEGAKNDTFRTKLDAIFAATFEVERRVVLGGALVVDRADLRANIGLLLTPDSPVCVLLVRGAPKSGKSHGNYLFEAAAKEAGAAPVYVGRDIVFTLDDVINELFAMVGGVPDELVKEKATTSDAWYRLVCNQLLKAANDHDARLWIAADDLGVDENDEPLIDEEIVRFFDQFVLSMKASQYRARFRLMLIHYPESTPTRWSKLIVKPETAAVDLIKEEAIVSFLRGWSEQRGKVIVEDQLKTLSTELMTGLDAPQPAAAPEVSRLERLYELLSAMTQRLEQA